MTEKYDFKKEWPKIKEQLVVLSKDAMVLVKKGEKEIVRYSQKGKLHVDTTALQMKKEHFYYLIGKEYVTGKDPGTPTPQLKKYLTEVEKIDREMKALKGKITPKTPVKKSVAKVKKKTTVKKKRTTKKTPSA